MDKVFEKIVSVLGAFLILATSVFILTIPAYLRADKSVDFFPPPKLRITLKISN